jgi:hypothetical protein
LGTREGQFRGKFPFVPFFCKRSRYKPAIKVPVEYYVICAELPSRRSDVLLCYVPPLHRMLL